MKKQTARINPKFWPSIVPNCGEDLFFGLYLISGKKHFNFRRKPFFLWSSFNFGDGITLFSLKYFRKTDRQTLFIAKSNNTHTHKKRKGENNYK